MTRRRVIVVIVAGLGVVAALWSYAVWQQYRIEQQLVGRWQRIEPDTGPWKVVTIISPDGQACQEVVDPYVLCRLLFWSVRAQQITFDTQPPRFHRVLQPLLRLIDHDRSARETYRFEVTANRLVFIDSEGSRSIFIRTAGD